jgi:hypothetical protein
MRLSGKWRITEMELWDQETIDLAGPAFIEIGDRGGQIRFIVVEGGLDCRSEVVDGKQRIDFTWEGTDDGEPTLGRGWLVAEPDGSLKGRIYFHHGDDSGFVAIPFTDVAAAKPRRASVRRRSR